MIVRTLENKLKVGHTNLVRDPLIVTCENIQKTRVSRICWFLYNLISKTRDESKIYSTLLISIKIEYHLSLNDLFITNPQTLKKRPKIIKGNDPNYKKIIIKDDPNIKLLSMELEYERNHTVLSTFAYTNVYQLH